MQKYEEQSKLERATKSELCDMICSYFFAKQQLISSKEMQLLADDIEYKFPKELSSIYFSKSDNKLSGILYDKYNNKLKALRRCQLMPGISRKRKAEETDDLRSNKNQAFTQDEVTSNDFVKYTTANIDFNLLQSHWRRSSRVRIDNYRQMNEQKFSTVYRALLRPDGHELVSFLN